MNEGGKIRIKVMGALFGGLTTSTRIGRYEFTYDSSCDDYDWLLVFDELPTKCERLACPRERAILCECLAFYAGDPAPTEIFPADCFIPIPIDDPAEAARIVKATIANGRERSILAGPCGGIRPAPPLRMPHPICGGS